MKTFVVLATLLAAACAAPQIVSITPAGQGVPTIVRAPAHDSASIESHRLGGNFAYSTAEAHAFARVTPQLATAVHPVAETTRIHHPAPIANVQPAPIVRTTHVADPVIAHEPVIAHQPVVGPVATHTSVEQPIVRAQHLVHQQHVVPATAYSQATIAAAPAAIGYGYAPAYNGLGYAAVNGLGYANGLIH